MELLKNAKELVESLNRICYEPKLEKTADEFAIRFAEWIPSTAYKESTCWRMYDKRDNEYTIEELLIIYKKENNL